MMERISNTVRTIFGIRDRHSEVTEAVDKLSDQSRKAATDAIDDLCRELTTTRDQVNGGEIN